MNAFTFQLFPTDNDSDCDNNSDIEILYDETITEYYNTFRNQTKCLECRQKSAVSKEDEETEELCEQCKNQNFANFLMMFIHLHRQETSRKIHTMAEMLQYVCENIQYFRIYRIFMEVIYSYMKLLEKYSPHIQNDTLKKKVEDVILDLDVVFSLMHRY